MLVVTVRHVCSALVCVTLHLSSTIECSLWLPVYATNAFYCNLFTMFYADTSACQPDLVTCVSEVRIYIYTHIPTYLVTYHTLLKHNLGGTAGLWLVRLFMFLCTGLLRKVNLSNVNCV